MSDHQRRRKILHVVDAYLREENQHLIPPIRMLEFIQPLITAMGSSPDEDSIKKAVVTGTIAWSMAVVVDPTHFDEEITRLSAAVGIDDPEQRQIYAGIMKQMIARHRHLYPEFHQESVRRRQQILRGNFSDNEET